METIADPVKLSQARPRVGFFYTCLVDMMRPEIGFASVRLLEDAGCQVDVPIAQEIVDGISVSVLSNVPS